MLATWNSKTNPFGLRARILGGHFVGHSNIVISLSRLVVLEEIYGRIHNTPSKYYVCVGHLRAHMRMVYRISRTRFTLGPIESLVSLSILIQRGPNTV
jgi:hypothetical protein